MWVCRLCSVMNLFSRSRKVITRLAEKATLHAYIIKSILLLQCAKYITLDILWCPITLLIVIHHRKMETVVIPSIKTRQRLLYTNAILQTVGCYLYRYIYIYGPVSSLTLASIHITHIKRITFVCKNIA